MEWSRRILFSVMCLGFVSCFSALATNVSYDGRAIKINGERRVFLSGSIHYPRSTEEMWPELIRKAKEGGLDTIETYVFWNIHEPIRRQYDFTGNKDIIRFLKTVQDAGLYAVLRIGPYVCAEWNYGGFPVWLHNMPGIELRTMNTVYTNEMQNFTTLIVDMVKKEKLFASQGGPVIIAQIENEYGNMISNYGDAGKQYLNWCANMAESLNIGVPWIMCQQSDAPPPMINTCNGWYCDDFTPTNPNTPKMWTENWTGWFKNWGGKDPHRTAEDLSYSVARFFQTGGTFQNYYMYHGGTNFGRVAGGPYITTTYDYDAPLDEFGNLNQPKWGHLKELHLLLKSMEKVLTYGDVNTIVFGNSVNATVYNTSETSSCFIGNANQTSDATITFQGTQYTIPAWSVSILPDCKKEVYNTAKVNVQTSIMVKKPNGAEDEPSSLSWEWRPEDVRDTTLQGKGTFAVNQLLEQKQATNDATDYLWYMTTVNIDKQDPIFGLDTTLKVNTTGHVLHAFVNGKHVGSQWAKIGGSNFVFEQKVKVNSGKNLIVLLSATVGLKNYGPFFDTAPTGILGAVELVAKIQNDETIIKNLSSYKWTYKVGLNGEERQLYDVQSHKKWYTEDLPINRMMTWYKTSFKAPLGTEPVVVDLQGLGKGHAWVNGQSIGRYWPSFLADEDGCSIDSQCDYRGPYSDSKCVTNCGKPSQRYYHVPRSFLHDDENTLVLFDEIGGNPSFINFKTITVGSACGNVHEGKTLELSCQGGRTISEIRFASFGDAQGTCGAFEKGTCEASIALSVIKQACVGKESCTIDASEANLGSSNCGSGITKRLAVEAIC
ncbi:beta-galactosidase 15 [Telopea speciosissima]|uniref:beta-galactosidase 15 n=1 Tax=Telopea speciosissima TaxID=54955 RepID=UPI001CC5C8F3|nr:beta-galactosidase 15 [Telopea speciosissima]